MIFWISDRASSSYFACQPLPWPLQPLPSSQMTWSCDQNSMWPFLPVWSSWAKLVFYVVLYLSNIHQLHRLKNIFIDNYRSSWQLPKNVKIWKSDVAESRQIRKKSSINKNVQNKRTPFTNASKVIVINGHNTSLHFIGFFSLLFCTQEFELQHI